MLSNFVAKKLTLNALYRQTAFRSFSLNSAHLSQALKDPEHQNWSQFFKGVSASDVAGSDTQSIG